MWKKILISFSSYIRNIRSRFFHTVLSGLVEGISVMNVLLILVSECTSEIGVRKAVGPSGATSCWNSCPSRSRFQRSAACWACSPGWAGTMVIVPIVKAVAKVPFQAAYTWNTFLVISVVAIVVSIVFGTYPALRAARLDPVEAIRRE